MSFEEAFHQLFFIQRDMFTAEKHAGMLAMREAFHQPFFIQRDMFTAEKHAGMLAMMRLFICIGTFLSR
jgi:hypothetical protein